MEETLLMEFYEVYKGPVHMTTDFSPSVKVCFSLLTLCPHGNGILCIFLKQVPEWNNLATGRQCCRVDAETRLFLLNDDIS